jgi:putative ABC transport system permease protein
MNVLTRGVRNAFRNHIRTFSLVLIIGLSIGLSLSMLVARQAVTAKIASVKASVGTSITVSPAGVRGFEGGGNPLTTSQVSKVASLPNVTNVTESLEDRLTTSDTNLVSSVSAGSLGQRFAQSSGGGGGGFGGFSGDSTTSTTFTPPISVLSSTDPTDVASTEGGGTLKLTSGQLFSSTSSANVAVVGTSLASKNNLKTGSTFTAYSTPITVVGIFDAGNTFTNSELLMPLTTLQTLSSQVGDVTSATVTANSLDNVASVTSAISKQLGSAADVTNDVQTADSTVAPLENIRTITLYSLIGAIIAGSVIILLTMIMIVRERRREIGVLKAIGASNLKVMGQFMTEAITLTVLGAIVGIVFGVVAANPITKLLVTNSTNSSTTTTVAGIGGGGGFRGGGAGGDVRIRTGGTGFRGLRNGVSNIHAIVGYSIIVDGLVAAVVIALLGSAAASFFISKVRPAEVMRVE